MFDGFYCLLLLHRGHQVEDPSKDWDKGTDLRRRVLAVRPIAQPDAYRFPGNLRLCSQEQRAPKALKYRPIQPLGFSFSIPCRRPPSPSDLSAFYRKAPWPDRETRRGRLCPLARSEELSQSWPSEALGAARVEWRTASRTVRMCVIHACLLDDSVLLHCCFVLWLHFPNLEQFLFSFLLSPHIFFFFFFLLPFVYWINFDGFFPITSLDIYVLLSYCLEFIFFFIDILTAPHLRPSFALYCFLTFRHSRLFAQMASRAGSPPEVGGNATNSTRLRSHWLGGVTPRQRSINELSKLISVLCLCSFSKAAEITVVQQSAASFLSRSSVCMFFLFSFFFLLYLYFPHRIRFVFRLFKSEPRVFAP